MHTISQRLRLARVCGMLIALAAAAPAYAGKDARLYDVHILSEIARVGDFPNGQDAIAPETIICNVGDTVIGWHAAMNPDHPFIAYAMYRLQNGRFEQLGRSWAKHTFFVQSQFFCGQCVNAGSQALGLGCADTYTNTTNANQFNLGPRQEIDPFTGIWNPCGSYFDGFPVDCLRNQGTGGLGPLDHRCVVNDSDLALPGATYCYEAMYIVSGDVDPSNNIGSKACTMSWLGTSWFYMTPFDGNPLLYGPAVATRYLTGAPNELLGTVSDPGTIYVASKATDLGGGTWHYEYAIYNYNYSRRIRSFAVPAPQEATVSNIEFHDGAGDPTNNWKGEFDPACGVVSWQTQTYGNNPAANALIWGALFNFRFDAKVAPGTGLVALDAFLPGDGANRLHTTVVTPSTGCIKGDVNGDGIIDGNDIQSFVQTLLNPPCEQSRAYCASDIDGNAAVNTLDAAGLAALLLGP